MQVFSTCDTHPLADELLYLQLQLFVATSDLSVRLNGIPGVSLSSHARLLDLRCQLCRDHLTGLQITLHPHIMFHRDLPQESVGFHQS